MVFQCKDWNYPFRSCCHLYEHYTNTRYITNIYMYGRIYVCMYNIMSCVKVSVYSRQLEMCVIIVSVSSSSIITPCLATFTYNRETLLRQCHPLYLFS